MGDKHLTFYHLFSLLQDSLYSNMVEKKGIHQFKDEAKCKIEMMTSHISIG
jgi:hypothetical protein